MFKANITQTPFTTDAADACFQNITGQLFGYDVSFLATLRALLAPRMGEEDRINLVFGSSNFEAGGSSRRLRRAGGQRYLRQLLSLRPGPVHHPQPEGQPGRK